VRQRQENIETEQSAGQIDKMKHNEKITQLCREKILSLRSQAALAILSHITCQEAFI